MAELEPLSNRVLGGKYLLGDLLGEGGVGAVYKALNQSLNRPQAIKVLLEKHLPRVVQRDYSKKTIMGKWASLAIVLMSHA